MAAPQKKAVLLLSGGLDSTTVLAEASQQGYAVHALTFLYGQRQAIEEQAARRAAQRYAVADFRTLALDLSWMGTSSLFAGQSAVPKGAAAQAEGAVPSTYVPGRNTVFLAHAFAWAEAVGALDIFLGVSAVDFAGYPDCRPGYVAAFMALCNQANAACAAGRAHFQVHAPLLHLSKAETIQRGLALGVDYAQTHSCYDPVGDAACGACNACQLRRQGFAAAGVVDPTRYAA